MAHGRPAPRPLEVEVEKRFRRWDARYAVARGEKYPHLLKPPPPIGAPGTGAVLWVGLNADPCRAKFLAKRGGCAGGYPVAQHAAAATAGSKLGSDGNPPCSSASSFVAPIGASAEAAAIVSLPHEPRRRGRPYSATAARAKAAVSTQGRLRPSSAPHGGRRGAGEGVENGATKRPRRPSSAPAVRVPPRDVTHMTAAEHYLEQKLGLLGALKEDSFGPNGPWPAHGAVKPEDLRELLYLGTSKDANGLGRAAYLKARNTMAPQDKGATPVTMSHDVGWSASRGSASAILRPVRSHAAIGVVPV